MSATQTIPAGLGLAALVTYGASLILPAPPPIEVHRLTYQAGVVTQYRTVTGPDEIVPMSWVAQVVLADTGVPLAECTGSGFWPYQTGRLEFTMPLTQWVGSDECTPDVLPDADLRLRVIYVHNLDQVVAQSDVFRGG